MNGWIDITIDDQDQTQVMLVPGGMIVMHTVRSAVARPRGDGDDHHYRPAMVFVPVRFQEDARAWVTEQIALREKAGAK